MRDNERYLAFSPAVSQAFLVHSGEVRHKIVGHEKVTLENRALLHAAISAAAHQVCGMLTTVHFRFTLPRRAI